MRVCQIEGHEVESAPFALHAEIEGLLFAQPLRQPAGEVLPCGAGFHRDAADDLAVLLLPDGDGAAVAVALEVDGDLPSLPQIEVLEAHGTVRAEVGHVLVRSLLPVSPLLG